MPEGPGGRWLRVASRQRSQHQSSAKGCGGSAAEGTWTGTGQWLCRACKAMAGEVGCPVVWAARCGRLVLPRSGWGRPTRAGQADCNWCRGQRGAKEGRARASVAASRVDSAAVDPPLPGLALAMPPKQRWCEMLPSQRPQPPPQECLSPALHRREWRHRVSGRGGLIPSMPLRAPPGPPAANK